MKDIKNRETIAISSGGGKKLLIFYHAALVCICLGSLVHQMGRPC